jgi:ABC-2 type transport system permease protein
MFALYKKEIRSFLSSLIGYIVIAVFLLVIGLFMWIFPGENNVLEMGYADLNTLFYIAPWVFMFLIPAITMRMFAEEKRTGTLEIIFTKPITDLQIVGAKYLAGVTLVALTLLPTLVYYVTVYSLGSPVGNIDAGGTMGSYIGLLMLAACYVAIGLFASSITSNQIVSFLFAAMISFFMYAGFASLGEYNLLGSADHFIKQLGIAEHYDSISRGVIDSRDMVYFIAIIFVFILLTKTVINSRKW